MNYGDTYPKSPQPAKASKSLVEALCNEAGYHREGLDNIEVEAKIDISSGEPGHALGEMSLSLVEKIHFPAPYYVDRSLGISRAVHECYGLLSDPPVEAFTRIIKDEKAKIKIKGKKEHHEYAGIHLLKRKEEHKGDLSPEETALFIAQEARTQSLPLTYVGSFEKQSRETFVFNPVSGRIFVVAANVCRAERRDDALFQLEVEYYGQVRGYKYAGGAMADEITVLVLDLIEDLPRLGYAGTSSTRTKFDWLAGNAR